MDVLTLGVTMLETNSERWETELLIPEKLDTCCIIPRFIFRIQRVLDLLD